jgi:hypothetical protein
MDFVLTLAKAVNQAGYVPARASPRSQDENAWRRMAFSDEPGNGVAGNACGSARIRPCRIFFRDLC